MRRTEAIVTAIFILTLASWTLGEPQTTPSGDVVVNQSAQSSRWPIQVQSSDAQITIFQPQMEDFSGETLKARAAVSIQPTGQQQAIYGAVWLTSRVSTDRVARTVQILDVDITQARFPGSDDATQQKYSDAIKQALLSRPVTLSLDQLLAMLETVQKEQAQAEDLQTAPPKIVFRDHPSIKVQYDGPPKLVQSSNAGLMRVANTPFFVALDPGSKTYWLKGAGLWFSAPDPMGPFQRAQTAPPAIAQLADADDYKDPQTPLTNAQALSVEIVTATDPTELVWTDGEPQMGTIAGTDLLYWTNTDSDVFLAIDSQQLYVLMSGRWYSGPSRNGPWTFVPSDKLPPDFARIPPDSDHGDVLAFVAGTQAAHDAVADTQIPQTAGVDRKNYDQPAVEYDGDPQFQAVQGTSCSYAVNTASAVVSVGGRYYCCDDAVWYTSAASTGPWDVCTAVPTDIYTLPPSCPVYSVRYCYVYGYTPDVVYCGYLPGYVGCYRYHDCVVYGTGYYYHPWWGHRYYPRPWTYGFAAHYNSYVGHWGFSFGLATGGGRSWIGDGPRAAGVLHPWFGYGGYRPVVVHNDVRVDMFRDQWRTRVHDERAEPVNRDRYVRNVYERRKDVRWEPARIQAAQIEHRDAEQHAQKADENRGGNDVFTDHQGNVYRRTTDGWEIRDQGNWTSARADQHDQHDVHAEEHPQAPAAEHHDDHPAAAEPHAAPVQPEQQHPAESHPAEQHPAAQHAEPAKDTHDLDRDYRARISGDQRMHGYSPSSDEHKASAPPADEHKADTHEAAPEHGGGGGGGGGSEDHKGK